MRHYITWNHTVTVIEVICQAIALGTVLFIAAAAVWAAGCLMGG